MLITSLASGACGKEKGLKETGHNTSHAAHMAVKNKEQRWVPGVASVAAAAALSKTLSPLTILAQDLEERMGRIYRERSK